MVLNAKETAALMTAKATLAGAMKGIANYIEKKKPVTLAEAEHMLAVVGVIAGETLLETA